MRIVEYPESDGTTISLDHGRVAHQGATVGKGGVVVWAPGPYPDGRSE